MIMVSFKRGYYKIIDDEDNYEFIVMEEDE
jgi:hypothetical protein